VEDVNAQLDRFGLGLCVGVVTVHRRGLRAARLEITARTHPPTSTYRELRGVIDDAVLDPDMAAVALGIVERLAAGEAAVHGTTLDEVRLHEVGGVDTIVDTVGVAAALRSLGVSRMVASPVATGRGMIETEHGPLPVPAPAVLEILRGAPIYGRPIDAELVTPTGAAILAACAESFGDLPAMRISSVGLGAGRADLPIPNVVRAVIGEPLEPPPDAPVEEVLVEATVDDMNPELFEYAAERLFAAGAVDVWLVPVIGRRGRPATIVQVLSPPPLEAAVREVLLAETTTIGVRSHPVARYMLERSWVDVEVEGERVRVKVAGRAGAVVNVAPEYADCAAAARATGRPIKEIYRRAQQEAARILS
ncbi:MAG: nickel pincer cofactor biosynthesis protein LarC, partial [Nocardioidaceae bacterium]